MDVISLKAKMGNLLKRKNQISEEIIKYKANYDLKVEELQDKFGIGPDEIEEKKTEMIAKIEGMELSLVENMKKLENFINTLENKLNAAKST